MPDKERNANPRHDQEVAKDALELMNVHMMCFAHEIRAPLHNIFSLCYAMKCVRDEVKQDHIYEEIKQEVYRAARVVDNVLSADLGQLGDANLDLRLVDLPALVRKCLETLARLGGERGISVRFEGGEERLTVRADPDMLTLALHNVIHNAVKYAHSHTCVEVRLRRTTEGVRVDVIDRGIGIRADELARVFEPYSMGSVRDSRRVIAGNGLGLFVARKIVQAHGGSISIESHPILGSSRTTGDDQLESHVVRVSLALPLDEGRTGGGMP